MVMQLRDAGLTMAAGALLALTLQANSQLAHDTSPVDATWVAHAVGCVVAFALTALPVNRIKRDAIAAVKHGHRASLWCYLGGIPGALTVVLAVIGINGSLSLSGTLALMLVGQMAFGIGVDAMGLLGTAKRRIGGKSLSAATLVLAGSAMILCDRA
jgi:transporter family-2 protein